jgi:signal peptidase I
MDDQPPQESMLRSAGELVVIVVVAFLLASSIKAWLVQPFVIPSASMEPTLLVGDRVLVDKTAYRFGTPHVGDVVVFYSPEDQRIDYIKRVIAVEGQTVEVREGVVYVDGKARTEPFVNQAAKDAYTSTSPVIVPAGSVWVMGDNRANSRDSRVFGPRPVSDLLGKAFCIYWPIGHLRSL